jgi:hypothetical protein
MNLRCHIPVPALRPDAHTATPTGTSRAHGRRTRRLTGLSVPPLPSFPSGQALINGSTILGGISSNTWLASRDRAPPNPDKPQRREHRGCPPAARLMVSAARGREGPARLLFFPLRCGGSLRPRRSSDSDARSPPPRASPLRYCPSRLPLIFVISAKEILSRCFVSVDLSRIRESSTASLNPSGC